MDHSVLMYVSVVQSYSPMKIIKFIMCVPLPGDLDTNATVPVTLPSPLFSFQGSRIP